MTPPIYCKPWETIANARLAAKQLKAEGVEYTAGDGTISKRMRVIWENAVATASSRARRGLAAMSPEKRAEISSKGGKRAHELGTAHQFTWAEACRAGRLGGEAIARDREHMAYIGLLGGRKRGENAAKRAAEGNLGGCADLST